MASNTPVPVRRRVPRSPGVQAGGHHLPPARLLGPDRPAPPLDHRRHGERDPAPLLLRGRPRAEGHQAAARRRAQAAAGPPGRRVPPGRPGRRPRLGPAGAGRQPVGAGPLQRRGGRPAGRRPGRVQRPGALRGGRGARCRHRRDRRAPGPRASGVPPTIRPPSTWRLPRPPSVDRSGGRPSPGAPSPRRPRFAHESERRFARILDFYGVPWEYEPVEFVLQWDDAGRPAAGSAPTSGCRSSVSSWSSPRSTSGWSPKRTARSDGSPALPRCPGQGPLPARHPGPAGQVRAGWRRRMAAAPPPVRRDRRSGAAGILPV